MPKTIPPKLYTKPMVTNDRRRALVETRRADLACGGPIALPENSPG